MGAHRQRRGAGPYRSPRAHNGRPRSNQRSQSKRIVGTVTLAIATIGLMTAAISLDTAIIAAHTAHRNEHTARIQLEIARSDERTARIDEAMARHALPKPGAPTNHSVHVPRGAQHGGKSRSSLARRRARVRSHN
jgi:hypothetical protein